MTYAVKEIFKTLQGEGAQAGRAAVFCRFAGCNLWSGREADRASAACTFCDTDFVGTNGIGGGKFNTAAELAMTLGKTWGPDQASRYVVFTGGEPLLQLDTALIEAVHAEGFEIAIETNGTLAAPAGIDWICVSPKGNNTLVQTRGDELKLVFRQSDALPEQFEALDFSHFFLQPMDGPDRLAATERAVQYCMDHPKWRLSVQTHKYIGIP
ncbi:7-carboxy-7-deazaguanine synthase [Advenella mimigardefordensis]|uniref:7-carboxy-7-deazaguanine synthase n=1 Tax=Advenella mimigardefordensis (strain DSM 17166 / LMG 22922 / DPN7) TaxID=1247726 RepID=W0PDB5_ADVMD|nr:7-carboxy-7-deazaguanine synthase [Advenella mimigardefordensis]AHG63457.1 putative organic radical activating enzyme [Advenella mimigardefordensis DPN7]